MIIEKHFSHSSYLKISAHNHATVHNKNADVSLQAKLLESFGLVMARRETAGNAHDGDGIRKVEERKVCNCTTLGPWQWVHPAKPPSHLVRI